MIQFKRARLFCLLLLFCISLLALLWFSNSMYLNTFSGISDFQAQSVDKGIMLTWSAVTSEKNYSAELSIHGSDRIQTITFPSDIHSHTFSDGQHGELYEFSIALKDDEGILIDQKSASALFLVYDELPDLPIISIQTVTNQKPSFTVIPSPEGYWGTTTESEYVLAEFSLLHNENERIQRPVRIRVRGNTSAAKRDKTPYKLKFETPIDLLKSERKNDSEQHADTEWLLISDSALFKTQIGTEVSLLCGMEYMPSYIPVNLIMNGDWMGSYLLIEPVKAGKSKVDLEYTGFLIENDAYWWNETAGNYFRTELQFETLGYTFKYPKSPSDAEMRSISDYMNAFEQAVYYNPPDAADFIDVNSFTHWLLIQDILGISDSGGANMFLYKQDLNPGNVFSSKLKLGPTWDFDSAFQVIDDWPAIHTTQILHMAALLNNKEFLDAYKKNWFQISPILSDHMQEFLSSYIAKYGEAIQESWKLESARWKTPCADVKQSLKEANDWFISRTEWLNNAIQAL